MILFSFSAEAWMDEWAPSFKFTKAHVKELDALSVSNFVHEAWADDDTESSRPHFSVGGTLDLNGDHVEDSIFVIPWMGCGLNAEGYDVDFIVSDGNGGWRKTVFKGYGASLEDLVLIAGRPYFRLSSFIGNLENSRHNHWAYQLFSFDAQGKVKCANNMVGKTLPAVTIYYKKPHFKQVPLTPADLKKITEASMPKVEKYSRCCNLSRSISK